MKQSISRALFTFRYHILIWAFFMGYEIIIIGLAVGKFGHPIAYASHYLLIMLFFYSYAFYSLPWSLKNKWQAIWRFPIMLTAILCAFIYGNFYLDNVLLHYGIAPSKATPILTSAYVYSIIYRSVYILGFASAYFLLRQFMAEKKRATEARIDRILTEEKMKRELSKAHNDFLKAQINPHFLFNTLDYVYQHIRVNSPDAADAIITLSEMMRYAIDSNEEEEYIRLGDEIEQVEKLIYLYQLRKNMQLMIQLDVEEEVMDIAFIPLVLMTMVENIFKHGNVADMQTGVRISVFVQEDKLHLETLNKLNLHPKENSTKAGLRNIKERIKFAYGQDASCQFTSDEEHFKAEVIVPLIRIQQQSHRKALLTPELN